MPLKQGFFVYCRELGGEGYRIGTAMMTDVAGDRTLDELYMMIPVGVEQAKLIERVFFVTSSSERVVEIEIDRSSQTKI